MYQEPSKEFVDISWLAGWKHIKKKLSLFGAKEWFPHILNLKPENVWRFCLKKSLEWSVSNQNSCWLVFCQSTNQLINSFSSTHSWISQLVPKCYQQILKRMVKIEAAEAETSWLLVRSVAQTPKTLDPTFPIMQLNCIFNLTPKCPLLSVLTRPFCNAGCLLRILSLESPSWDNIRWHQYDVIKVIFSDNCFHRLSSSLCDD